MTTIIRGIAAGAVLVLALSAGAAQDKVIEKKPADREPTNDREFVIQALSSDMAEVKMGEYGAKHARNADVRAFAQRMVEDHSKNRDALLERARDLKVAVVEGLEKDHRDKMARLSKLEGSEFDREFMRCMVEDHEKAVRLYEKWSRDASDENVRNLAKRALPIIKDHLARARQLADKLKD